MLADSTSPSPPLPPQSSYSQEIGWEERLRYDLFSVEWDVKR